MALMKTIINLYHNLLRHLLCPRRSLPLVFCMLLMAFGGGVSWAQNPTEPQMMPISCGKPKPKKQSGLRRPKGDGNVWTFAIDPAAGVRWIEGPNWQYPGEGAGADPAWGAWGGGDGQTWLSWISPQIASEFAIRVTGKITCGEGGGGEGGGGGGGGGEQPIDIEASWEGDVTGSYVLSVRRKGSGRAFGGVATVAAGAVGNEVHQADVEITVKDEQGTPQVGVAVPGVRVKSGGRGTTELPGDITAAVSINGTTTDADGKVYGTFTSGNREEDTVLILDVDGDQETSENEPTATITQVWNELPYEEAWSPDEEWNYDAEQPLYYKMAYSDGVSVPIKGHSMTPVTILLEGFEWDDAGGEDWDDDGIPDGDYLPVTYDGRGNVESSGWGDLIEYSAVTGDANGKYSFTRKVRFDWDFLADNTDFDLVDNNAYFEEW